MASRLRLSGQVKHIKIKLYVKATETLNNPVSFVCSFCSLNRCTSTYPAVPFVHFASPGAPLANETASLIVVEYSVKLPVFKLNVKHVFLYKKVQNMLTADHWNYCHETCALVWQTGAWSQMASRAFYHLNIIMFSPVLNFWCGYQTRLYIANTHVVISMLKKAKICVSRASF